LEGKIEAKSIRITLIPTSTLEADY